MVSTNDFTKMNDRTLVTIAQTDESKIRRDKAIETLLKRYERQIYKNWFRLRTSMNDSDIVMSLQEDYFEEANEVFFTAVQKVDLSRIENDNWKLVGMVNWYLMNLKTKLRKEVLNKAKVKSITHMHNVAEDESSAVDPDVEDAYRNSVGFRNEPEFALMEEESINNCSNAINQCKKIWSPIELEIFKGLLKHQTKADIAKNIGCKTSKVYTTIKKMKDDMKGYLFAEAY